MACRPCTLHNSVGVAIKAVKFMQQNGSLAGCFHSCSFKNTSGRGDRLLHKGLTATLSAYTPALRVQERQAAGHQPHVTAGSNSARGSKLLCMRGLGPR